MLGRDSQSFQRFMAQTGAAMAALVIAGATCAASPDYMIDHEQCRRVQLTDTDTGAGVTGAEDLAFDPHANMLFVSAYNRRKVEKAAARKKSKTIPTGGLYKIAINDLLMVKGDHLTVRSLIRADDVAGGLRPHGITYHPATEELIFINRAFVREKGKWRMTPMLERVGADGAVYMGPLEGTKCAANDLAVLGSDTYVSFDHAKCNWQGGLEDVFSQKKSGVVRSADNVPLYNKAGFANGVVTTVNNKLALAATREKALHLFDQDGRDLRLEDKITLPGGPDNLTIAADGAIIAAVHPSLLRMGMHRRLGWGKAPSRIVRIDPDRRDVSILFDDKSGNLFSAATVAVDTKEALILGSVTDEGLLVCHKQGAPG